MSDLSSSNFENMNDTSIWIPLVLKHLKNHQ